MIEVLMVRHASTIDVPKFNSDITGDLEFFFK